MAPVMRWLTLYFILIWTIGSSQNIKYDSIYNEVSQELSNSTPEEHLASIDYLFKIANNDEEKVKTLLLKASLLRIYGLKSEAITILEQADKLADSLPNGPGYIARINGLLSTLYRENGITWSGKKALNRAIEVSKEIKDKNAAYRFQGNLQQELAYYAVEDKDYTKAISILKPGRLIFKKLSSDANPLFHLATTDQLIGKIYLELNEVDSAFFHLEKANIELKHSLNPNSSLKGFIYNDLGKVHIKMKEYDTAESFYMKALKIAETTNFYNLKIKVYANLQAYYQATSDVDNYFIYDKKKMDLIEEESESRKAIANRLIQTLQQKGSTPVKRKTNRYLFITGGFIALFITSFYIYTYDRKKGDKNFSFFKNKESRLLEKLRGNELKTSNQSTKFDNGYMSPETEREILEKLAQFEKSKDYLNKNISLTYVSAQLGVNNRYLSYVIKKHYQKDFASYVNEMRIAYTIECLKNNPKYLQYKISYLAELAGFSSHSRFTITFKKVTGISPSVYIQNLKKSK